VTWCLYHGALDRSGRARDEGMVIVGFLNGRVQRIPAASVPAHDPWKTQPKL
jgi:hypothetical protein